MRRFPQAAGWGGPPMSGGNSVECSCGDGQTYKLETRKTGRLILEWAAFSVLRL